MDPIPARRLGRRQHPSAAVRGQRPPGPRPGPAHARRRPGADRRVPRRRSSTGCVADRLVVAPTAAALRHPPSVAGRDSPARPYAAPPMRPPKDFFRPLAVGAPEPVREIPFRPSRMIHFLPPSNPKMVGQGADDRPDRRRAARQPRGRRAGERQGGGPGRADRDRQGVDARRHAALDARQLARLAVGARRPRRRRHRDRRPPRRHHDPQGRRPRGHPLRRPPRRPARGPRRGQPADPPPRHPRDGPRRRQRGGDLRRVAAACRASASDPPTSRPTAG